MVHAAIVGLGWWGKIITKTLEASGKIRVIAAVEPNQEAGRAFCEQAGIRYYENFEDVLGERDVDVVILTSPHRFHEEQIIKAASAGKHVFCEKPLALSLDAATRAVKACIAQDVRLGIGHERRFEPPMVLLQNLFRDGVLGELLQIEGNFSHDKFLALAPDNWRLSRAEAACGPMTATGIHLLDLSVSLGKGAREVYATNRSLVTGFESGDSLSSNISLSNGAVAAINANLATPFYSRFTVFGSRGWIEIRDKSHVEAPTGWTMLRSSASGQPTITDYPVASPVLTNLEAFADAVRGTQKDYPVPLQEMLDTVAALEAVFESTLNGNIVHARSVNVDGM
ncbi:MAG: Gfo/Idh/MocA family oxidoreductase [Pseudomonadota bacterium]